jgi:glycine cleavage system aminomethyltransferase T
MGYVANDHAKDGSSVFIEIRNRKAEAEVQKPPFVKKK